MSGLSSFGGSGMRSWLYTHMHTSVLVHRQPPYLPPPYRLNPRFQPRRSLRWLDWSPLLRSCNFSGQWQVLFCVSSTRSCEQAAKRDREQRGYCSSVPNWHASHHPFWGTQVQDGAEWPVLGWQLFPHFLPLLFCTGAHTLEKEVWYYPVGAEKLREILN